LDSAFVANIICPIAVTVSPVDQQRISALGWQQREFYTSQELAGTIYSHPQHNQVVVGLNGLYSKLQGLNLSLIPATPHGLTGNVHKGVSTLVHNLFGSMVQAIQNINHGLQGHPEIIFTGHGLGGSVALLCMAQFLSIHNENLPNQIKVVTFSAPHLGDQTFVHHLHQLASELNILQFYCSLDIVAKGADIGDDLLIREYIAFVFLMDPTAGMNAALQFFQFCIGKELFKKQFPYRAAGIRIEILATEQLTSKAQEYIIDEFNNMTPQKAGAYIASLLGIHTLLTAKIQFIVYGVVITGTTIKTLHATPTRDALEERFRTFQEDFDTESFSIADIHKVGKANFFNIRTNPIMGFFYSQFLGRK